MDFSGKWLLELLPYSVLLVRQWIHVLASGGCSNVFPTFFYVKVDLGS